MTLIKIMGKTTKEEQTEFSHRKLLNYWHPMKTMYASLAEREKLWPKNY